MKKVWIPIATLVVAVIVGLVVGGILKPSTLWQQSTQPQLDNPGFEGGFYESGGVGELVVGNSWQVWYNPALKRPEYKPETLDIGRARVRSGAYAQKFFTTYAAHDAGIYQELYGVVPGQWYKFSAWGYQWSSEQDNPDVSTKDGKCSVLVGINPWGDANPRARTTVWGKEALQVYNQWVQVSVEAQAWSEKIVVAVRQVCEWPVKHNDAYWDDTKLELGGTGDAVTPAPTYTPYPTYTPAPTCTPCPAGGSCPSIDDIRRTIREEIDRTTIYLGGKP